MKVNMYRSGPDLDIQDALTLKRAERWLEVGRPRLALHEMEGLGLRCWDHPWADRLLDAIWPLPSERRRGEMAGRSA